MAVFVPLLAIPNMRHMQLNIRLIASLMAAFAVSPCLAADAWVMVSERGMVPTFFAPATVRSHGSVITVETLVEYPEATGRTPKSVRAVQSIDCDQKELKITSVVGYRELGGRGTRMYAGKPTNWIPVPRETPAADLTERICRLEQVNPKEPPSTPVYDWELVSEGLTSDFYLNQRLIEVHRTSKEYWLLMNYNTPEPEGAQSTFILLETDCRRQTLRFLNLRLFSGPMGTGRPIKIVAGSGGWLPFKGSSRAGTVAEFICTQFC